MQKTYSVIIFVAVAVLCSIGLSCKKDNPIVPPTQPGHTAITFTCTFTSTRWCRLEWSNDSAAASHHYMLIRDNRDTLYNDSMMVGVATKILQDTVLKPGTNYSYWIYRIVDGKHWDSATVNVRTLDTTKTNYTWEMTRLGKSGSTLKSIWGTSSHSFWICGWIDSGSKYSDIVHYVDGIPQSFLFGGGNGEWENCYGLSDSSVYFAGLASIAHYDGNKFVLWALVDTIGLPGQPGGGQFLAIWVTPDDKEIFAVGSSGLIIHRKPDRSWEVQQSGTTLPLVSIAGFASNDLYATGAGPTTGVLIHYDGTSWKTVIKGDPNPPDSTYLLGPFNCVSGSSGDSLVLVGQEIYHRFGDHWQIRHPKTQWELTSMEGVEATKWNSTIVTGDFGEILNWNGEKWTMITDFLNYGGDLSLNRALTVDGELFIVGGDRNSAVLIHGK